MRRSMRSGRMPSVPGALPQAKLSIALLSFSSVGSASKSSIIGRGSMASNDPWSRALSSALPVDGRLVLPIPSYLPHR